jgi:hypothetical protein
MALVSVRLKGWWGSADVVLTDEDVYGAAETKALGATAEEGEGIGVRRVHCVMNRTPVGSVEDVALCTMDFLNMTGSDPDDTWTAGDFGTLEALLDTFWTAEMSNQWNKITLAQYRWYRIGPGVTKPNPAVRITTKSITGSATIGMPPQLAVTVTEKTGVQRAWGRFYLPAPAYATTTLDGPSGRIHNTYLSGLSTRATNLFDGAAAADFLPVVYSKRHSKVYGVEKLQCDDLYDVQRPRRWDRPLSRLVTTVGP